MICYADYVCAGFTYQTFIYDVLIAVAFTLFVVLVSHLVSR